ncbi:DUF3899 domain-containing protein [Paenibacillus thiaminolyticus]|uniref:DUF3899 domain-containing protein n=1 Tax=Paenibacillus thiaminolyticus TaxID=49283 RepID=UPI002542C359|nr:DUF3899 domain-containing protein [Paenibacillus thiaminolyticus]WII36111.1 DUF3899 domain-containing protein [Paenibacillus thiaminolyticus]
MKRLSLITLLLVLAYLIYNSHVPIHINLSNSFFIIGLVYLCIALFCHVRNIGFFNSLSYHLQRKRQAEDAANRIDAAGGESISKPKLHEHAARIGSGPWPNRQFYLFAIPLLLCSFALAYASM